ncbi:CTLH/CRA C-terminal to lish motif domain-containing protein [Piptocephalis cylindrospora]|uniref:CTLH/CRA C-terminal to lish motif domain-containing protein n=1 Tax=Piptocephalis cylindrospora TaxID=1907219 RepID=A0A4V1IYK3_9FUNG|nr:CTLH/CRA C-terminal to lish motif domain-containing protein [Piptocephalis cylindrospora]|eukprot:RKP14859.1 CTLH/CRA C-terminal to lish motif domain-containing protein [Piptocephalis cylindrospora]
MEPQARETLGEDKWKSQMANYPLKQRQLDKLVLDYLLVSGYETTAAHFTQSASLQDQYAKYGRLHTEERQGIREAVLSGNIDLAMARINNLDPELLDSNPALHFDLQRQKLVEFIRSGETASALSFAQDELAPRGESFPGLLDELERTMVLFAYQDPYQSPAAPLMDMGQRQRCASAVNAALLQSLSAPGSSKLADALHLFHWTHDHVEQRMDITAVDSDLEEALNPSGKTHSDSMDDTPMEL